MFSIVIPYWNKRHVFAATLGSVRAQTWRDYELIVVDDGSTDGGMALLEQWDDPRVRTLSQANAGPGAARNAGIQAARLDWIAFLDADDLWLPDHLAELDRIRKICPEAGLIGTAYARHGRGESDSLRRNSAPEIGLIDYFEREADGAAVLCSSTAAIPKSTFAALGGFGHASLGADSEYWARIALERPVATSTRVTAIYLLGTGGLTDRVLRTKRLGPLRRLGDLGPVMALIDERSAEFRGEARPAGIDRFVDYRLRLSIREAARAGDIAALRDLPRLHSRPPRAADRLILAAARLPGPLAAALFDLGFHAKALFRLLKRKLRHAG